METILAEKASRNRKKILIDLRWMIPGEAGGIENLSRSLLKELAEVDTSTQFTVLAPYQVKYDLGINNLDNFKVIPIDGPAAYWRKFSWRFQRFLSNRLHFDYWRSPEVEDLLRLASYQVEVALSIPGYIYPDLKPIPNVLIVPDIQHEYFPEFFTPVELEERRRLYTDSIHHSVFLLAISEFTRQTLMEKLSVPPEKVVTAHLAADSIFQLDALDPTDSASVLKKYGLEGKQYFFFPGNTWKHKNHKTAFKALSILLESTQKDIILVCTGSIKSAETDLVELLTDLHLEDRVKFLGYCPRNDLPGLYKNAVGLIFPSYFEGFGLPVLEAMLSGCPVICSGTSSLPEIAGDAAILCDPDSPAEFAHGMRRILEDSELRTDLIRKGRLQAAKFSWGKFTDQTLAALETVVDEKYHPGQSFISEPVSFNRKTGSRSLSRQDQAQLMINQYREYKRQNQPLNAIVAGLKSCLIAPDVAFFVGFHSCLEKLKQFGKIPRKITPLSNRFRKVNAPQTQELLAHTQLWPDNWAGPHLVLLKTTQNNPHFVDLDGWADIRSLGGPLQIKICIDGQFVGQHCVSHSGDFHFQIKLNQPLCIGNHTVEITSNRYFSPHKPGNSDDYRPLSFNLREFNFIDSN